MTVESTLSAEPAPSRWRLGGAGDRLVLRNAFALVTAYVLPRGALFISTVVAARVLGGATFGAYSAAGALAVIASIIATAGMQPLLVREMTRNPATAPALLRTAHRAKTLTAILMLVCTGIIAGFVFQYPPDVVAATLALAIAYAIGSYAENFGAWFQAHERMHIWAQATTVFGVVSAVCGVAAVLVTRDIVALCAAQIVGQCACVAWLARAYRVESRPGFDTLPRSRAITPAGAIGVPALLRNALPFAAAFLALTIFYKCDVLIVERLRGVREAGMYGAGFRLADATVALALAGIGAAYPRLVRNAGGRGYANRAILVCVSIAAPFALLVSASATGIVGLLFGDAYLPAAPVLALLAAAFPALACNLLAGYLLGAENAVRIMGYAGGVAVKLLLAIVLVPLYGAMGAAGAMLACELAMCGVFMTVLHRRGSLSAAVPVLLICGFPAIVVALVRVLT